MLEIKNLSVGYKNTPVLENISLKLEKNYTLLGSNGSGKSSFAKALVQSVAYKGEVLYNGTNIKEYTQKELSRSIAYVPTKLEIYEKNITTEEFLLLCRYALYDGYFSPSAKDKQAVEQALGFVGLKGKKETPLGSLSSGESALVLIASSLVTEAEVIIFDEPTANLDPKNRKKVVEILALLQKKYQLLFITHDIELAEYFGFDILFVQEKKITRYTHKSFFDDRVLSEAYGVCFQDKKVVLDALS